MTVSLKQKGCATGLSVIQAPIPGGTFIQEPPEVQGQVHKGTTRQAQVAELIKSINLALTYYITMPRKESEICINYIRLVIR